MDYLQILLDALQRRNAHYVVAAIVNNTDLLHQDRWRHDSLHRPGRHPGAHKSPSQGMLVLNPQAKNFEMQLKLEIAGKEVAIHRGWCSVDVEVAARWPALSTRTWRRVSSISSSSTKLRTFERFTPDAAFP